VLAALLGSGLFVALMEYAHQPPERAAFQAIVATFVFRGLAIFFNWKTTPVWQETAEKR
jgi:uncharacterized membrane protein YeiH